MKYADLLNSYIENSGLTLDKLVEACKNKGVSIHATYISKLRKGQRMAPSEEISKVLAEVCGHDPQELINAGYMEKTPFPILKKMGHYEEILESIRPALLKIISSDSFLKHLSNALGYQISAATAENMFNELSAAEQLHVITDAGLVCKANVRENGKVDFWLEDSGEAKSISITSPFTSKTANFIDTIPLKNARIIDLPVYGVVRAGVGGYALQEFLGTKSWMAKNGDFKDVFMLKIQGDSMYPRFFPGDFAVVRPQHDVDSGDPAIVIVDDEEGLIKRIKKVPNGIILHSDNQLYEDREFYNEDVNRVHIVGKVIDIKPGRL